MSYDVHVYTREQTPLDIGRLTERMRSLGWEIRVLDDREREPVVLAAGPLPANGLVYGWDRELQQADELDVRFPFGSTVDVYSFPEELQMVFDGCAVYHEQAEEYADQWDPENWTPEGWKEFRQSISQEKYQHLRVAPVRYYLRTSAHANLFRFIFQTDLALAIAREVEGLIEDPQTGEYSWAHEVTPNPRTPIERAEEEYRAIKRATSWWAEPLNVLTGGVDIHALPSGVNNLIWLAMLESGLSIFRIVLGLRFQHQFSAWFLLLTCAFLAMAFGLFRGWRWAWWTMLVGYTVLQGTEILFSKGFGIHDMVQVLLVGIAVTCLSLRSTREYFGM